jgi:hypothetical protein
LDASLLPFDPIGWATGGSPATVPVKYKSSSPEILSWTCALLQSTSSSKPPLRQQLLSDLIGRRGSSHEVCSPSAFPRSQQQLCWPGLPHPSACVLRFSRPLDAFSIHCEPAGLVSCRIRSWGCTLQSFVPTAWPDTVSSADPLLTLVLLVSISPVARVQPTEVNVSFAPVAPACITVGRNPDETRRAVSPLCG